MLLYCVYCNCRWTLVTIFVTAEHYIALRVALLTDEMDKATMNIIQHLHWNTKQMISEAKMQLLINRLARKAPGLTVDMRSRVNRLLTHNNKRLYTE